MTTKYQDLLAMESSQPQNFFLHQYTKLGIYASFYNWLLWQLSMHHYNAPEFCLSLLHCHKGKSYKEITECVFNNMILGNNV
jgi:nitrate/TMAO reductase-like tetraheme cytochrome c subunit